MQCQCNSDLNLIGGRKGLRNQTSGSVVHVLEEEMEKR